MVEIKKGSCHCKAVEFEVEWHEGPGDLRRCDCSLCHRKGAVMAGIPLERLRVTKGQENLTMYQWNTGIAKHYFCKLCGIYTHHQRRTAPDEFGYNIACLEDQSAFDGVEIELANGASNSVVEGLR